ncbi:hypothetical protein [Variovorax paradoxus]|uniref:hypothetical protein n=1 Tax=Variovorax paradoxus TaxID=34073 RepID=UPI0005A540C8|nr:hypothetical protein [Variovorax paradoxus]
MRTTEPSVATAYSPLNVIGVDHVPFEHLFGLIDAVREGHDLDVILLGLHANATREMALVPVQKQFCKAST